jgi:hypothetical protein
MQLGEEEPRHAPVVRLASTFPWRPFDRKSEEVVNAQADSGGKNCEQCCSAATKRLREVEVGAMSRLNCRGGNGWRAYSLLESVAPHGKKTQSNGIYRSKFYYLVKLGRSTCTTLYQAMVDGIFDITVDQRTFIGKNQRFLNGIAALFEADRGAYVSNVAAARAWFKGGDSRPDMIAGWLTDNGMFRD